MTEDEAWAAHWAEIAPYTNALPELPSGVRQASQQRGKLYESAWRAGWRAHAAHTPAPTSTATDIAIGHAATLIAEYVEADDRSRGYDPTPDQVAAIKADARDVARYLAENGALLA